MGFKGNDYFKLRIYNFKNHEYKTQSNGKKHYRRKTIKIK